MKTALIHFFINLWGTILLTSTNIFDHIFCYERSIILKDHNDHSVTDVTWSYWIYRFVYLMTCKNILLMSSTLTRKGVFVVTYKHDKQHRIVLAHHVDEINRHVEHSILHRKPFRPPVINIIGTVNDVQKPLSKMVQSFSLYDENIHLHDLLTLWDVEKMEIQIIGKGKKEINSGTDHAMKIRDLFV
jgi:hypothetical protein